MKKGFLHIILPLALIIITAISGSPLFAQVKIGQNPTSINPDAVVEMESNNKGLLLPRLALHSTLNPTPLGNFVNGMVVYNTATTDSITPGVYYSDGIKWIRINSTGPAGGPVPLTNWSLTGNNGTIPGINFVGTTDNNALVVKTNNSERMRITENGWVGIGTAAPTAALQVKGQLVIDSLNSGNIRTDSILVANPANGRVKMVSAAGFGSGVQKKLELVSTASQAVFTTPAPATDASKIMLYRNGVMISFTVTGPSSITAEIACSAGDEIRIIQLL